MKYLVTITLALASLTAAHAITYGPSQAELGREYDRDQQIDTIYNNANRSRYEPLISYPTY